MIPYQAKSNKLAGSNYKEVRESAMFVFHKIASKTKRKPYVRSAYFRENKKKQKIFFDYFWEHLFQKNPKERMKRLKYFQAALEVIAESRNHPIAEKNHYKKNETLYRFSGLTRDKSLFFVQIKKDEKTGKRYLMSCFPVE